jgi:hypothetical protein
VVVAPDNSLQPSYHPINQPQYLEMLRKQGKTYRSTVVGQLAGRASKTDWGVQGAAYFTYVYGTSSSGKILNNDGLTIVEERHFDKVTESVLVSGYEVGVVVPERIQGFLRWLSDATNSRVVKAVGVAVNDLGQVRVPLTDESAEKLGGSLGLDPKKMVSDVKLFTQGTDDRLLEGKTVRITFMDGKGVTQIEPVGCTLSQKEQDVIIRTNFILDHYVFPDRKVGPGDEWKVDGSAFGGFLDPRLEGKVAGEATVVREPDFEATGGSISNRLKLADGHLAVETPDATHVVSGDMTGLRGKLVIPKDLGIVTSAWLTGYAEYNNLSRDHLLFKAMQEVQAKFEINYTCTVE